MELYEQLIDTWHIHNRLLYYLMDAVPEAALVGVSASKGRSVGQMLGHIHNVRLMWLEAAAPDLMSSVTKIPASKKDVIEKSAVRAALEASEKAIETLLKQGLESGRVKGFKPHPMAFYTYLTAHEWYHIGEIGMTQAGYPLDQKVSYGLWEWGVR